MHTPRPEVPGIEFPDLLIPSFEKGAACQTHFLFRAADAATESLEVRLDGVDQDDRALFAKQKKVQGIAAEEYPYGFSEAHWWPYCLGAHSYLPLGDGTCQVGLNFHTRFLHLDLRQHRAHWVDPGIGGELLSSTNWLDPETHEVWFASWPVADTVRRLRHPDAGVRVSIWKMAGDWGCVDCVWQGDLGDSLHQVAVHRDRRFLVLTELGLRSVKAPPTVPPDPSSNAWQEVLAEGLVPSQVLILDLTTRREWRFPLPTAGHVEFDPLDPAVCYLSGHNIGLLGPNVGIFGPAQIQKVRLTESGPRPLGAFTHPRFHRITTHIVFRHRGRTLIGVSGYPDTVYLIDADTMKLHGTLALQALDPVDATRIPHLCRQDSYGLAASGDGEAILVAGTGFVFVACVADTRVVFQAVIGDASRCRFTGHLGHVARVQGRTPC